MARVYSVKAKDGSVRWGIDYKTPNGKREQRIVADKKMVAQRVLARVLSGIEDGTYVGGGKRKATLADLWTLWLESRSAKRTLHTDKHRWRWVVEHFGEHRRADQLTTSDFVRFREWLSKQSIKPRGKHERARAKERGLLKAPSINRIIQLLRAVFNYACSLPSSERPVRENPARFVKMLREERRDRVASPEEIERLQRRASPRLRLAILIAVEMGLRAGEIAKLTWSDVDLAQGTFCLRDVKSTETVVRDRTVAISDKVIVELRAEPRSLRDKRVVRYLSNHISTRFCELTARLKIENLHFHDLRHTCATNMRRSGVDIVTIAEMLGHSSMSSVRRYQTVSVEDMRRALRRSSILSD